MEDFPLLTLVGVATHLLRELGAQAWQQTRDLFAANQPQRSTYYGSRAL